MENLLKPTWEEITYVDPMAEFKAAMEEWKKNGVLNPLNDAVPFTQGTPQHPINNMEDAEAFQVVLAPGVNEEDVICDVHHEMAVDRANRNGDFFAGADLGYALDTTVTATWTVGENGITPVNYINTNIIIT